MMTNLDESVSLLGTLDPEDVDDISLELQNWFGEVRDVLGVSSTDELSDATTDKSKITKGKLGNWMQEACDMLARQQIALEGKRNVVEGLKTQLIASRGHVIHLQGKLLESKDEQLNSLQTNVQSAVQETVKTEIRSYGDAVKKSIPTTAINTDTLKEVVQNVIVAEDRSRNLMVFNLKEEEGELRAAKSKKSTLLSLSC